MKNINIRKIYYHLRHTYMTLPNLIVVVAFLIAANWAWGSIGMMQRNYKLQKEIDTKTQQQLVAELDTQTLELEQKYYKSAEYQELEARRRLNLANPGEKLLILPPNSDAAKQADLDRPDATKPIKETGNFGQWMNFLFGSSGKSQ